MLICQKKKRICCQIYATCQSKSCHIQEGQIAITFSPQLKRVPFPAAFYCG